MYQRARLGIGYLPQEASIFRGLTVEQNIRAVLEVVEPNRKKRERSSTSCSKSSTSPACARRRRSRCPAASGGVEIARALATTPEFHAARRALCRHRSDRGGDIQALVRHLTNRGIGVLITDHNVRETLGLTDRAYIIHAGEFT
jgi:lipopolysaccharide export system ATP-binding protein